MFFKNGIIYNKIYTSHSLTTTNEISVDFSKTITKMFQFIVHIINNSTILYIEFSFSEKFTSQGICTSTILINLIQIFVNNQTPLIH